MPKIQFNLIPCIAVIVCIPTLVFILIGLGSSYGGWAGAPGIGVGWKGFCTNRCYNHASDDNQWYTGGNAAAAGGFITLFGLIFLIIIGIFNTLGACGFLRITAIVAAVVSFLLSLCLLICWAVWAGCTQKYRDNLDLTVGYAFYLTVLADVILVIIGLLHVVSIFLPVTLYPAGERGLRYQRAPN
eukprot:TRINITY_DN11906_c0_g1_i1.p1 TRINITY_DN11906_c0_g1~~TRINITY_DN11906_c0_g1_i1.p1  ORF type:complete len:186 (-),score=23.02 TRINITY_DN11906_c0_g1_i1:62-619(-)